ncbi:hypothetical protein BV20DRAFT_1057648 [Pilatotrama ljubarskyi]|nr:hypothetical protein BV20DRAFT_1057648 [Pilatotrama ljubarskyi]
MTGTTPIALAMPSSLHVISSDVVAGVGGTNHPGNSPEHAKATESGHTTGSPPSSEAPDSRKLAVDTEFR